MYRGFYYLRKLFQTGSSVTIDDFSSLRINGPYALLKLGPDFAAIKNGNYTIEVTGNDLIIDLLSEEVAVFTFTAITKLIIITQEEDGTPYG